MGGLRLNLGKYLERRGLSAYRVVKETTGRVAPNTVYDLARKPARRVDLETVSEVMSALERITGETVTLNDLIAQEAPPGAPADLSGLNVSPEVAGLIRQAAATMRVRPGRPGGRIGLAEPVELEGEGPSTSEIVIQMRRQRDW